MKAKIGSRLLSMIKPQRTRFDVFDSDLPGFLLRVEPSGVMTFYARYRLLDGRRQMQKIGPASILSVAQARTKAQEILADVVRGEDPAKEKRAARAHTLRSFIAEEYEPWAVANRKSGRDTVMRLKASFATLLDRRLTEVTAWDVEKLRAAWMKKAAVNETGKRKRVKVSGNRDIACFKGLFSRAVEWGHLKENPLRPVKLAKTDAEAKIRIMTPEEETRVWAALDARETAQREERARFNKWRAERGYVQFPDLNAVTFTDYLKPLITVLLHTGIRRGEAFSMEWMDVNFEKRTLTVRGETAKSGKTRVIPLNGIALDTLTAWREQSTQGSPLIFPSPVTGGRLSHINSSWRALVKAAIVKGLRTHDLRHTFASRCLARGADIATVRELLGHQDIKTTAIYLHATAENKAAAVARLVDERVINFEKASTKAAGGLKDS